MSRKLILQNLMKLAQGIGANPQKFMGTRTNINFLGKGPTRNPLFQQPLDFLGPEGRGITAEALGDRGKLISAIEDAMGYATAGKLNPIQTEMLSGNLKGIYEILHPPVLPSASVTPIAPGIEGLRRFPKETHKFFGRPLKDKDFSEIDRMVMEGKIPDAKGRTWNFKSKLPEPGSAGVTAMLDQKTGMSRAIAREILQKDVRLNLKPEELYSLRTGSKGEDPIDLMVKYYGRSMTNFDEFLNSVNLQAAAPAEFAEMVLKNVRLTPQFAHGGLAGILEV